MRQKVFLAFTVLVLVFSISKGYLSKVLGTRNSDDDQITLILGGDVMLGRTVMTKSLDLDDTSYPFRKISGTLSKADLVFVNLENPIVTNCPRHYDGMKFCADPKMVEGLRYAGVDIVNLANNHTLNYGKAGFEETKKFLTESGISFVGDNNLAIKQYNNIKFGFLGFDFVSKKAKDADFELVKDLDSKVDVLIVAVHWGVEYQLIANSQQQAAAKKLIEAGADVVVGHHPHWVQNIEYINGIPIYYSLGNLVFDQMWSQKTREGLLMKLTFEGKNLVSEEMLPVFMNNWAQPELVN